MEKLTAFFDSFRSIASTISVSDILDILIVAVIIYGIITRIRSSSAMRIAATIVLLLVVTWLTDVAKMRTLHFLLSNILEIGFIALIIVFQPELRRMLEHVGARSLSMLTNQRNTMSSAEHVVARTVSACEVMSRERTGVLIVF